MDIVEKEAFLRLVATLLLVSTACLVRFDTQTKLLFYSVRIKATYRDMDALKDLVGIVSTAAAYNMLQLVRCFLTSRFNGTITKSHKNMAWFNFLLDQAVVYVVFAANSGAFEASLLVVNGSSSFQWMKLCNRFTRFCFQIGWALFCGYIASILMAVVSSISAFCLFRLYSPRKFMLLKT